MQYKIELMKPEELMETLKLVRDVFDEFEAPGYSQEGIENFNQFANFENIQKCLEENLKIIVAKIENKIVGMIAVRSYAHIAMLFVDKKFHRKGIAKNLVEKAKKYCEQYHQNLEAITVNSSPYAVGFYEKMGFVKMSDEQIVDGIRFTPMKLVIYQFCEYQDEDFENLHRIKKDCFKWYVEKIYGWDDKKQIEFSKDFIREHKKDMKVIVCMRQKIGVFTNYIDENKESVISLFFIDKKFQNQGIGTNILKEQLKEDERNCRSTILQVFKENKARFLYEKMGFEVYDETETHYKMRRKLKKEEL